MISKCILNSVIMICQECHFVRITVKVLHRKEIVTGSAMVMLERVRLFISNSTGYLAPTGCQVITHNSAHKSLIRQYGSHFFSEILVAIIKFSMKESNLITCAIAIGKVWAFLSEGQCVNHSYRDGRQNCPDVIAPSIYLKDAVLLVRDPHSPL